MQNMHMKAKRIRAMRNIQQLRARLEQAKGRRDAYRAQLASEKGRLTALTRELDEAQSAHQILQESARLTQEKIRYRVSQLVTLGMEAVFKEPYTFHIQFDALRGKTSAEIQFLLGEDAINPLDAAGGGVCDVAALTLQFSLFTLRGNLRPLMILDEPLKWLKGGDLPDKGAQLLYELSHKLGIQIIMVSHSPELIEHADKVFRVTKKHGISTIRVVE